MNQPHNTPLNADGELRRFIVQEIAHMVADGMKTGVFEDWTIANKIADIILADRKKHDLQARYNELLHVYDSNGLYFYDDKEDGVTVGQRIAELKQELEKL